MASWSSRSSAVGATGVLISLGASTSAATSISSSSSAVVGSNGSAARVMLLAIRLRLLASCCASSHSTGETSKWYNSARCSLLSCLSFLDPISSETELT